MITMIATLMGSTSLIGRDRPVRYDQLPAKARQTIETHFPGTTLSYATFDNDPFEQHYEVVLTNGIKIDFRKNGEWRTIDCERSAVPTALLPASVLDFVRSHHPNNQVVEIDRDGREMDVQLNNGMDLKFTPSGRFKYYDD